MRAKTSPLFEIAPRARASQSVCQHNRTRGSQLIDLLLRVAVDYERDGFGEFELWPAVQGGELLTIQLERHRHHLAFLFGKVFARVMRDLLHFRILEHRDVEFAASSA
jgi:hypothetical protein